MERAPATVNVLSFILMTRRLGFCAKASARAAMPLGLIPFCGIETSSSDPITWWATRKLLENDGDE